MQDMMGEGNNQTRPTQGPGHHQQQHGTTSDRDRSSWSPKDGLTAATSNATANDVDDEDKRERSPSFSHNSVASGPVHKNEDAELSLWQSMRKYRRIMCYCIGMTSGMLMYGYDYVIVGTITAMPSFQYDLGENLNGEWIIPSLWLGLWNFASPGTATIGALLGGYFQDKLGRKKSLAVGSIFSAVAVALCFVSYLPAAINARRGVFLAGKCAQGAALGMVMVTTMTYLSEILPPNLRGPVLAFFPIFLLVGQLVGALVIFAFMEAANGYVVAFASQWPFSALTFVVAFVIPESPTFLVRHDRMEEAFRAQARLDRGVEGGDTATATATAMDTARAHVECIRSDIQHERRQAKPTYLDSFRAPNRRRTFIVMFANSLPQLFGLTLLAKMSYFMQVVGLSPDESVLAIILGIGLGIVANVMGMWTLSRFGRRPLILTTMSVSAVLWFSVGVAGLFTGKAVAWFTAAGMISVAVVCGLGVWPGSYVVGAESSSLQMRGRAQGIAWFTAASENALIGFVLPYIFNPDQGNLRGRIGFLYAALCVVGVLGSFFHVPEMKGRTPAEIDRMFDEKLPARKFIDWVNPESLPHRRQNEGV